MRINIDNKVVWCSEMFLDTHKKEVVQSTRYDTIFVAIKLYRRGILDIFFETQIEFEEYLKAMLNGYEFKLETKKYYWRKKKEHLAWFEIQERSYLNYKEADGEAVLADNYETASIKTKFTEQKAKELLKEDFDKFEKVECE